MVLLELAKLSSLRYYIHCTGILFVAKVFCLFLRYFVCCLGILCVAMGGGGGGGGGFTPIFMKLPKLGFEKAVAQQSRTLGIRTKFDGNRPINRSNINIFEQDQLNMKGKPKLHVLCNL